MQIILVWGIIFLHMCIVWVWYRYLKNPSVVDVGWASGLTLAGLLYIYTNPVHPRSMILSSLLIIWGLRLGLYLWLSRIRKGKIDKRYLQLSKTWTIAKPLGFFLNFQLQGLLIMLISLPWFFISTPQRYNLHYLDTFAYILAIIAIVGETIADNQLQQFKRMHPGKVCDSGLWRYSRHPNYFFEWLTWCAFTLFALSNTLGWVAILSPLALYWLMTRITGPMTETGSLESRGQAYLDYQARTPLFFPTFK